MCIPINILNRVSVLLHRPSLRGFFGSRRRFNPWLVLLLRWLLHSDDWLGYIDLILTLFVKVDVVVATGHLSHLDWLLVGAFVLLLVAQKAVTDGVHVLGFFVGHQNVSAMMSFDYNVF